ncbi:hypothetical protein [Sansalvadorimonas verongulae]|uniref:hypothetical protein n=1 Tax=Sansalvadorimonas verongulae TaxID=2172824 RepID=UPI0012BD2EC7|nr:hypothetical protein [Sansalvadorimonas verongulae]MTI15586.1 hypothetical protein [Sansalvadorimonas verongulae]
MKAVGVALLAGLSFSGICFGYGNANCGEASDIDSHFLCCAEPGHAESSIWVSGPAHSFHCDDGWQDSCGSDTPLWSDEYDKLTTDTMADYCEEHNKPAPVFQ